VYNQLKESAQLQTLSEHIIANNTENVWQYIRHKCKQTPATRIDFVLDNAGFELYTDLCLAEFLLEKKLCQKVQFHVKDIPWFVSDSSRADLLWTVKECASSDDPAVKDLGKRWQQRLDKATFVIVNKAYWTYGNDYASMQRLDLDLYQYLSESSLVIFKGDLNYRKLVGDRDWPTTTTFAEALNGFCPAPICALRTLKADVVVGLKDGKAEELEAVTEKWMVCGEYAVVQFCDKLE